MSNKKELTPSEIASMSEVLAKYMDKTIYGILETGSNPLKGYFTPDRFEYAINAGYKLQFQYISSRNWQHEVWEKVRDYKKLPIRHLVAIHKGFLYGSLQDTFIALFEAVEFINSLKK